MNTKISRCLWAAAPVARRAPERRPCRHRDSRLRDHKSSAGSPRTRAHRYCWPHEWAERKPNFGKVERRSALAIKERARPPVALSRRRHENQMIGARRRRLRDGARNPISGREAQEARARRAGRRGRSSESVATPATDKRADVSDTGGLSRWRNSRALGGSGEGTPARIASEKSRPTCRPRWRACRCGRATSDLLAACSCRARRAHRRNPADSR